jgi:hypothetical protein
MVRGLIPAGEIYGFDRVYYLVNDVAENVETAEGRGQSFDIKGKYGLVSRQREKKH